MVFSRFGGCSKCSSRGARVEGINYWCCDARLSRCLLCVGAGEDGKRGASEGWEKKSDEMIRAHLVGQHHAHWFATTTASL